MMFSSKAFRKLRGIRYACLRKPLDEEMCVELRSPVVPRYCYRFLSGYPRTTLFRISLIPDLGLDEGICLINCYAC